MATCKLTYALRVGDRVLSISYGVGTLKQISSYRTGESIAWVDFDAAPLKRFGWVKTPLANLRREPAV